MKFSITVTIFCLLGLLISCSNSINDHNVLPPDDDISLARVIIPLPVSQGGRSVGLPSARYNTNFFEIEFRRISGGIFTATATDEDESIEMEIPVGTYDVLLFAGNRNISFSPTPLLLASSFVQNIDITLTGENIINLELNTIDVRISAPENVSLGETFSISVEIDTKNPLIYIGSSNMTSGLGRLNRGDSSTDMWLSFWRESLHGNVHTFTVTGITSPLIVTTGFVNLRFSILGLFENAVPFDYIGWGIAHYNHPTLGQYFQRPVNFILGQELPNVTINITWPE